MAGEFWVGVPITAPQPNVHLQCHPSHVICNIFPPMSPSRVIRNVPPYTNFRLSRKSPAMGGCLLGHSGRVMAGRCGDFPRTCHSNIPQNYLHSHIVWQVNFGLASQSPRLSPTSTSNVTPLTSSATSFPQCHPPASSATCLPTPISG